MTVSKSYLDAYNDAFGATANDRASAIAAMQAIDQAWEEIALNAELWAEYKQVAAEAEAIINGNQYGEGARSFLNDYYQSVYQRHLNALDLSNEALPEYIEELQDYINWAITGGWTGISSVPADNGQRTTNNRIWTLDGKSVNSTQQPGLYIIRSHDGKVRKVLR